MRALLFPILLLANASAFCQTIEGIDSLVDKIEQTNFTDSVLFPVQLSRLKAPVQITAFLKNDTLLKTIARFSNTPRRRFTYYQFVNEKFSNAIYIKDIDTTTDTLCMEIAGKDNIISGEILKFRIYDSSDSNSHNIYYPSETLSRSNYSAEVGFAMVERKAEKYHFKARLVKAIALPPPCGGLASAVAQKFQVISTTHPGYKNRFVVIIQPCPDFLGSGFFQTGKNYDIDVATNSGVTFGYFMTNQYQQETIPTFWSRKIKRNPR